MSGRGAGRGPHRPRAVRLGAEAKGRAEREFGSERAAELLDPRRLRTGAGVMAPQAGRRPECRSAISFQIERNQMKEIRRRLALAHELWVTSRRGRREVAVFASCGDDRPLAAGSLCGLGPRRARIGSVRVAWSEVGWVEASPCARCQNCLREHGPLQSCFIGMLAGVIVDRGELDVSPEQLARVHVDEAWDRYGGPAVDWLEDHLRWLEVNGEV